MAVASALGVEPDAVDERRPNSAWRWRLVEALIEATGDLDADVARWLRLGAPAGYFRKVPRGPYFPATEEGDALAQADVVSALKNHPSFYETHGKPVAPAVALVLEAVDKGLGVKYRSREEAELAVGQCFPAPLGNVRKPNKHNTR